jgi:glycosyltransferase involved in cell wall biosynthesis
VFGKARASGTLCVLNYPLAHHRFTRRYLEEEAARQPAFAETLNSHDWPEWQERQLDAEIELADHILVGSNFACESFIAEGVPAQKLTVIPYGADTALFEPPEQKVHDRNGLRLLFVGQIGQRKGISYLLEAARRTAAQGDSLTLVGQIQGSGRALVPYRDGFRHVPHVPRVELREIYRQADVFVFPTLVEGMGIVVLEAMASGLPVITTPNGPGDIVRDGVDGFLVPPRDVDAIVERLERLRADPQLRQEMARNARIRAQEFTWDAYRKKTVVALRGWLDGVQAQSPSPQAEVSHVRS